MLRLSAVHFKLGATLLTSYPAHSAGDALGEARVPAGILCPRSRPEDAVGEHHENLPPN
jgi:hypothetical protein